MQSWKALLVAGTLIGSAIGSPAAMAETPSVSPEVEQIVDTAYAQWHSSLGVRQGCSGTAKVIYEEIDGRRGEYRTRTGEIVIDPSDSTSGLGSIVVHELSHHTFLACGAFADEDFTSAFYAAQDLPEGRDWFDYAVGWSAAPAEHFAEAMAITIYGSGEGGIPVGTETSALISRWLAGAPVTPPAVSHEPIPYSSSTGLQEDDGAADSGGQAPVVAESTATEQPLAPYLSAVELVAHTSVSVFSLTQGRVSGPI